MGQLKRRHTPELCWHEEEVDRLAGGPDDPVEEVDGGELGAELGPGLAQAAALQQGGEHHEGDGEEGRREQLVSQDLLGYGRGGLSGDELVEVQVPVVVRGALGEWRGSGGGSIKISTRSSIKSAFFEYILNP